MKNIFAKFLFFTIFVFITFNAYADRQMVTTPEFSIMLPDTMKQIDKENKDKITLYVYASPPYKMNAPQSITIIVMPWSETSTEHDEKIWIKSAMTMFLLINRVDLSSAIISQVEQIPESLEMNNLPYLMTVLTYESTQAYVLSTIMNHKCYVVILASSDKDPVAQENQMAELRTSLRSLDYS